MIVVADSGPLHYLILLAKGDERDRHRDLRLAAYPAARYVLDRATANPAFDVIKGKFCRAVKVFP